MVWVYFLRFFFLLDILLIDFVLEVFDKEDFFSVLIESGRFKFVVFK